MARYVHPLTFVLGVSLASCSQAPTQFVGPDAGLPNDVPVFDDLPLDATRRQDVMLVRRDVAPETDVELRENCETPFDDNGDGRANENCACLPGSEQMCFQRGGELFREPCRMGRQRCEGMGELGRWGECAGSWLPLPEAEQQCALTEGFNNATAVRPPVDIVWFVDNSGSMTEETRYVNMNLNLFASIMQASGLDFRVVMVARRGTGSLQVCVPPPLGGASCGDTARFRHVDQQVESTDGLSLVLSTLPRWRDFVRLQSLKFFVAVTDDDSALPADAFDRMIRAEPAFERYTFHSIVGYNDRTECPSLARVGSVYLTLTDRTGGERARVCAMDWSMIFRSFAEAIVRRTNFWQLTRPARAETIQVWSVNNEGRRTPLPMSAWTYDPMTNRITVDPAMFPRDNAGLEITYRPAEASP
jgi:hypothetical protein